VPVGSTEAEKRQRDSGPVSDVQVRVGTDRVQPGVPQLLFDMWVTVGEDQWCILPEPQRIAAVQREMRLQGLEGCATLERRGR